MRALLVIDMQEDYLGEARNRRRFPYRPESLISRVNHRILEVVDDGGLVVYILNRFFYQSRKFVPRPVEGLRVETGMLVVKSRPSCFARPELEHLLRENHVSQVEVAGVDGNGCVAASALGGVERGFSVVVNLPLVEAAKAARLDTTLARLRAAGVQIQE